MFTIYQPLLEMLANFRIPPSCPKSPVKFLCKSPPPKPLLSSFFLSKPSPEESESSKESSLVGFFGDSQ